MWKYVLITICLLQGSVAEPAKDPLVGRQQALASSPTPISALNPDQAGSGTRVINVGTLIVLFVYTIFAGLQWWAIRGQATNMQGQLEEMKRHADLMKTSLEETRKIVLQNERAEDNEKRTLRAYVNVRLEAEFVQEANPAQVRLEVVNFGKTPADSVRFVVRVEVRKLDDPPTKPDLNDLPLVGSGVPLAPSMSIIRIEETAQHITAEEADLIRKRKARLFVWGIVGYKDIFKEERYTSFYYVHNPPNENLEGTFHYNEAT
jgi:hypothetical protein